MVRPLQARIVSVDFIAHFEDPHCGDVAGGGGCGSVHSVTTAIFLGMCAQSFSRFDETQGARSLQNDSAGANGCVRVWDCSTVAYDICSNEMSARIARTP